MNPEVSELRQRVLDLRQHHTFLEVAALTGVPLGTVKSWCTRSGAFRDNLKHRTLFTLPPLRTSGETLPAVPEVPAPSAVTGDRELDAVLWLRQVIQTGHPALIDQALARARGIGTPAEVLERRYAAFLAGQNPGSEFVAALSSIGFADLEKLARETIKREQRRSEAAARFGERVFDLTPAEAFCAEALAGLEPRGMFGEFDHGESEAAFQSHPALLPHTLGDCLAELDYWGALYRLRNAVDRGYYDNPVETRARMHFVFGLLAQRRVRFKAEAVAVFRYLAAEQHMDDSRADGILLHLLGGSAG